MKFYHLDSGMFKSSIIFCVGSPSSFKRWLKRKLPIVDAKQRAIVSKSEGLTWKLIQQDGNLFYLLWVRRLTNIGPISHELIHLSMFILDDLDVPVTPTQHEVLCYLQEHFIEQVEKIKNGRTRELKLTYPEVAELADAAASKAAACKKAWGFDSPSRDQITIKL